MVFRNLSYVNKGHPRQKLDLYVPKTDDKVPLIIFIHGGGFSRGDKGDQNPAPLLSEHFAVASINYRLSQDAIFPAQIEDCKAAVRWLRKNAAQYNLDPDRFPRANLVRYHGIFGPAAKWRPLIVPSPAKSEPDDTTCRDAYSVSRPRNYSWAELMRRVFEIDVLKCERCGGRSRIIAAIHPPDTTRKILECLGLPSRAPPVARAAPDSLFEEL
jgi:hypothetical protein